jgi:hypothetical protein
MSKPTITPPTTQTELTEAPMTKAERTELCQLIRKRERVMKTATEERAAELKAQFESQLSAVYHYDDDAVWRSAYEDAELVLAQSREQVAQRCRERGIPREFAPRLSLEWYGRGQNALASRRTELRRAANAQIDAMVKGARTKIEKLSLEAQTEVIANGLQSKAAREFLEHMPKIEDLMPVLEFEEIKKLTNEE